MNKHAVLRATIMARFNLYASIEINIQKSIIFHINLFLHKEPHE
jgi:hypothetical protein